MEVGREPLPRSPYYRFANMEQLLYYSWTDARGEGTYGFVDKGS